MQSDTNMYDYVASGISRDIFVDEYVWLDSENNFRSKTRISSDKKPQEWNFDGSSTGQATTTSSEVWLTPVKVILDPFRDATSFSAIECRIVLCSLDGDTRSKSLDTFASVADTMPMFGFEQEVFVFDSNNERPVGWTHTHIQKPQKNFYCGVGNQYISPALRKYADNVMLNALYAGLKVTGFNFEVAIGQIEFQVCDYGITAADSLILLRYIMERTAELSDLCINYHPKALGPEWNGSGLHTNVSTKETRTELDSVKRLETIMNLVTKLEKRHETAMKIYGTDNELRLTGKHETSSYTKFTSGVGDRTASVRIPSKSDHQHYFEDRRPASNADPYIVSQFILETCLLDKTDAVAVVDYTVSAC